MDLIKWQVTCRCQKCVKFGSRSGSLTKCMLPESGVSGYLEGLVENGAGWMGDYSRGTTMLEIWVMDAERGVVAIGMKECYKHKIIWSFISKWKESSSGLLTC